jgi:hypothetical protein
MKDIHNYAKRLKRAVWRLEKAPINEIDKDLIRRFVEFKAAEKVGIPRQEKYFRMLRVIGERYIGVENPFSSCNDFTHRHINRNYDKGI